MTELAIDDSQAPRSYRVSGEADGGSRAGNIAGVLIGAVLIAAGVAGVDHALTFLGPQSGRDPGWMLWTLTQLVAGTFALGASGVALGGLALLIIVAIGTLAPGATAWQLDGSGLCGASGVGPFKRTRLRFVPFEGIAEIRRTAGSVSVYVWRNGRSAYECDIASGLDGEEAERLTTLLNDDLAAARAEWASQGLVTHPRAVDLDR